MSIHFFSLLLSSHFCSDWLSWLGLGNQVGSTVYHLTNFYQPSRRALINLSKYSKLPFLEKTTIDTFWIPFLLFRPKCSSDGHFAAFFLSQRWISQVQFFYLFVCPFVRLSVCPFVRLSVCPFVRLFLQFFFAWIRTRNFLLFISFLQINVRSIWDQ